MTESEREPDYFISYTKVDKDWADWVAWYLDNAGYKVVYQDWDFRPGSNFIVEMNNAATSSRRTLLIMTPNFFKSGFTEAEWTAAFAKDPTGAKRGLLPVLVEKTDLPALLAQVVYIDLTDKDGDEALSALLAGIDPGRSKPDQAPVFPGQTSKPIDAPQKPVSGPQVATSSTGLDWRAESGSSTTTWRTESRSGSRSVLELQLVPTSTELIPVSRLSRMGDELTNIGRQGGLFTAGAQVETDADADRIQVWTPSDRDRDESGILLTRQGGRGAWITMPTDMLGSIFDPKELPSRLAAVIKLLMSLDLQIAERYIVSARLSDISMMSVGEVRVLGMRNSASMPFVGKSTIELPIEDSVRGSAILTNADVVADELVARLHARLK